MRNKSTVLSLLFLLFMFLMTGIYQDDEFAEFDSFVKYSPDLQFYFKSPLGMQDMPSNYPPDLLAEERKYGDFILAKHWSDGLGGLALLLQVLSAFVIFRLLYLLYRKICVGKYI